MFDHVVFGASDYEASKAFFIKALEPIGIAVASEGPLGVELSSDGKSSLCIRRVEETPAHLHLVADLKRSKETVPEPISTRAYSGKFMVRVPPEVHRMLAIKAAESGVSINRLVSSKLS